MHRRALLVSLAALAGCGGDADDGDGDGDGDANATGSAPSERTTARTSTATEDAGAGLAVVNAGESRYVTVVVYDGDEALFSASRQYAADGDDATARFGDVVSRAGTYRVVVETAGGRRETVEWRVVNPVGRLVVEIGETFETRHTVVCAPECPPVSLDGRADLSGALGGAKPHTLRSAPERGYAVTLVNRGESDHLVDVSFDYGGREVLSYRYRVPPEIGLDFPTLAPGPPFGVRVTAGADVWRAEWRGASELTLPLRVDADGVGVDCADGSATLGVSTDGGQGQVTVTARRGGYVVAQETLGSSAREPVYVEEFLAEPGVYDVEAVRENGTRTSRTVLVCGATFLRVRLTRAGVRLASFPEGEGDDGDGDDADDDGDAA